MDRHIGGLEQKEMPVTGKVLMASSILPGDRLSEVTVLSDDADHRAARHPSPSRGVALQVTENRGEIVAHASLPGNRLPGRRRRVYILREPSLRAYREGKAMPQYMVERHLPGITP